MFPSRSTGGLGESSIRSGQGGRPPMAAVSLGGVGVVDEDLAAHEHAAVHGQVARQGGGPEGNDQGGGRFRILEDLGEDPDLLEAQGGTHLRIHEILQAPDLDGHGAFLGVVLEGQVALLGDIPGNLEGHVRLLGDLPADCDGHAWKRSHGLLHDLVVSVEGAGFQLYRAQVFRNRLLVHQHVDQGFRFPTLVGDHDDPLCHAHSPSGSSSLQGATARGGTGMSCFPLPARASAACWVLLSSGRRGPGRRVRVAGDWPSARGPGVDRDEDHAERKSRANFSWKAQPLAVSWHHTNRKPESPEHITSLNPNRSSPRLLSLSPRGDYSTVGRAVCTRDGPLHFRGGAIQAPFSSPA